MIGQDSSALIEPHGSASAGESHRINVTTPWGKRSAVPRVVYGHRFRLHRSIHPVNAKPGCAQPKIVTGWVPQRLYGVLVFVAVVAGAWDELVGAGHELATGADPEFGIDLA